MGVGHVTGEGHSHSHHQGHHHHHAAGAPGALKRALAMTLGFMFVEAVGGWWANSLALLSDAGHMATDAAAMILSLAVVWIAKRPASPQLSFGYQRAEILGALASGMAIWALAGFLVYEAVQRMASPPDVNGPAVFWIALVGLAANLVSMRFLHHAKEHSINVRAAYLHLIADALGSVGALVAGAVLWWTGWRPIDPIVTVVFSGLMIFGSWELVKEAVGVLMEGVPSNVDPVAVREELSGLDGVREVHDLHIWSVSAGRNALSVHLIAKTGGSVLGRANELLQEKFGIVHTTIQIEDPEEFKSERCYDCG